jgi:hypothetical protein
LAKKVASEADIALPEARPGIPWSARARDKDRRRALFQYAIEEFLPIAGLEFADQPNH